MESSNAGLCDYAFTTTGSNSKTNCNLGIPNNDEENPSLYEVGEMVLALNDNKFWTAKVVEINYESKTWKYFIHYMGWKKSWDEWLGEECLKKLNDDNVHNFICKDNTKAVQASASVIRGKKKRRKGALDMGKDTVPMENFVNLQLSSMLKKQLLDDCEFISLMGKLVKLPRSPNVDAILRMYISYRSEKHGEVSKALKEFAMCLCGFFNKALPVILLYKSERDQYTDAIKDGSAPSAVYGAEHLLRLYVKLPELLAGANIEEETLMVLQTNFVSFLKFLKMNQTSFFLSAYHALEETETSTNREDVH
ncbi:protein MRG2-like isoform X2 [Euphorbia lathyris]|uniref:protein MRG2-like isoform X2 n=1 Tax=Euphorbia lathyris TaxID=212925 RepID=UPI003313BD7D